jgi:hypothetical protein
MNEIKKGIVDFAALSTDLMTALENRLWYAVSNDATLTFPYSVFTFQPIAGSITSESKYKDFICQFTVYDNNQSSEICSDITKLINNVFDRCERAIIIEGYYVLSFRYLLQREYFDTSLNLWTSIIQFKVKLQKGAN